MTRKSDAGFSLIEVTMALLLIGIVMGFVFKSAPLLESAQLRSVVQNVEAYRVATQLFVEKYGYFPGDCPTAKEFIAPYLRDGNGNSRIEGHGMAHDSEAFWFWQHLGAAGFIAHPGRVPDHQPITFGHGVPSAKTGGGFTVAHPPMGDRPVSGIWLLLGNHNGEENTRALLTPLQVKYILDLCGEGDPLNGSVRAHAGVDVPPDSCVRGERLNMRTAYPACVVYFRL